MTRELVNVRVCILHTPLLFAVFFCQAATYCQYLAKFLRHLLTVKKYQSGVDITLNLTLYRFFFLGPSWTNFQRLCVTLFINAPL